MNKELVDYIKKRLAKGSTIEQIRASLLQAGYDKQTANEYLATFIYKKNDHLKNAIIVSVVVIFLIAVVILYLKPSYVRQEPQPVVPQQQLGFVEPEQNYLLIGQRAYSNGEYGQSTEYFKKAIAAMPNSSEPYSWLGYSLYMQNNYEDAATAFNNALKINPSDGTDYYYLGRIYCIEKRYDLCEEMYRKSVGIKPTTNAYSALGWLFYETGAYKESIENFKLALALGSSSSYVYEGIVMSITG